MADYNRFVSYIYLYERGIKTMNTGFAKVESRGGQCRVNITMKNMYHESHVKFSAYMFVRESGKLLGIYMGDLTTQNSSGEFSCVTDSGNIEGSGYGLEDIKGMIIRGENGKIYGTGWDDEALAVDRFMPLGEQKEDSASGHMRAAAALASADMKEEAAASAAPPSAPESDFPGFAAAKPEVSPPSAPATDASAPAPAPRTAAAKPENEAPAPASVPRAAAAKPESDGPEGATSGEVHMTSASAAAPVTQVDTAAPVIAPMTQADMAADGSSPVPMRVLDGGRFNDAVQMECSAQTKSDSKGQQAGEVRPESQAQAPSVLEKIIDQGMRMYPFEDDQITACVRLEPQDIGMLPMQYWRLASNSFLLHGYYSYRHLIMAQRNDGTFIFGIPGVNYERERFMASMFGFDQFKPVRANAREGSEFGYWYMELKNGLSV